MSALVEALEHGGDRRRSGAKANPAVPFVEIGETTLQGLSRGIAGPGEWVAFVDPGLSCA